jgi:DNA-binding response OmpR family regulator
LLVTVVSNGDIQLTGAVCASQGIDVSRLAQAERAGLVTRGGGRTDVRHPLVRATLYAKADKACEDVRLTPIEWNFLELLARNLGRLVPRQQILREVLEPAYVGESHYLRFYAAQLRRKLEDDPGRPRHLIASPGLGYTLRE